MARLNRETFGRRGPTNVIAFPMEESAFPPAHESPKDASRTTPNETPAGRESPPFSEETRRGTACRAPGPLPGEQRLSEETRRGTACRARTPHADRPPVMLGEVVISLETTRRQAMETGWDWEELLDFFLIHGILHLLGYDHEDPESQARMDAKTWELMGLLHPEIRKDEVI